MLTALNAAVALVVDDDAIKRKLLYQVFHKQDCQVVEASNDNEAIEKYLKVVKNAGGNRYD